MDLLKTFSTLRAQPHSAPLHSYPLGVGARAGRWAGRRAVAGGMDGGSEVARTLAAHASLVAYLSRHGAAQAR